MCGSSQRLALLGPAHSGSAEKPAELAQTRSPRPPGPEGHAAPEPQRGQCRAAVRTSALCPRRPKADSTAKDREVREETPEQSTVTWPRADQHLFFQGQSHLASKNMDLSSCQGSAARTRGLPVTQCSTGRLPSKPRPLAHVSKIRARVPEQPPMREPWGVATA